MYKTVISNKIDSIENALLASLFPIDKVNIYFLKH